MPEVISIHEYKGVTFNVMKGVCEDTHHGGLLEYYYWTRDDMEWPYNIPLMPSLSLEDAIQSAENEVDGLHKVTTEDMMTAAAICQSIIEHHRQDEEDDEEEG